MAKLFILLLSILITFSVMAEGMVRSVGGGPSFELSPAIVFANPNGDFQIGGFSESGTPIKLETYFNGNKMNFFDRQWTFRSTLPSTYLYSYMTFKSTEGYLTSIATALIVSYKLKTDLENGIGMAFYPDYNGYLRDNTRIFAMITPGYGRQNLTVMLGGEKLWNLSLSPFDDSPRIFEFLMNTKKIQDGIHTFSAMTQLVTGQFLSTQQKMGIDNEGPKMVSLSEKDLFLDGNYVITVTATDLIGLSDSELYVKNPDGTLEFVGKSDFVDGKAKFTFNDFTGSKNFVLKISDLSGLSKSYEFAVSNNQSLIIPLIVFAFALGVIFLTFLK